MTRRPTRVAPRFYFDEDADARLAEALRSRGYDVETTAAAGRRRTPDDDQLAYAVDQGRVFVTHNIRHFPRIHAEWIAAERGHRGLVVLIGQARIGVWLRRMEHLLKHLSAEELVNRLVFLGAEYDDPEPHPG